MGTNKRNNNFVVCMEWVEPLYFTDNIKVKCCKCNKILQMRPYNKNKGKPICKKCCAEIMTKTNMIVKIDKKTEEELSNYFGPKMAG